MIDLAGSERVKKSEAAGQVLKEAQHINKSLSALGDVISSLKSKAAHIPFRNSKLTYLLQECLSGNSKCLMVCQISPSSADASESSCSLKFALRVRNVQLGEAKKQTAKAGTGMSAADLDKLKTQLTTAQNENKAKTEQTESLRSKLSNYEDLNRSKDETIAKLTAQLKQKEKELATAKDESATLQQKLRAVPSPPAVVTVAAPAPAPAPAPAVINRAPSNPTPSAFVSLPSVIATRSAPVVMPASPKPLAATTVSMSASAAAAAASNDDFVANTDFESELNSFAPTTVPAVSTGSMVTSRTATVLPPAPKGKSCVCVYVATRRLSSVLHRLLFGWLVGCLRAVLL